MKPAPAFTLAAILALFGAAAAPSVRAQPPGSTSSGAQAQYQETIGYPADVHGYSLTVRGAPGTHFEAFLSRPGGGARVPFGGAGTLPAGGMITLSVWGGGVPALPASRVEVWSVSTSPVRMHMQIH